MYYRYVDSFEANLIRHNKTIEPDRGLVSGLSPTGMKRVQTLKNISQWHTRQPNG
jgi:hypothetical protein